MKVKNRKNITINQRLVAGREFKKDIILQFQPDEMIVKFITCWGNYAAIQNYACNVFCPTINETLGSFTDGCNLAPNLVFLAKNYPINTEWTFRIVNVADGKINTDYVSDLSIQLEFVEYHDK